MGKHYELKEDKIAFLVELWCREHGREVDKLLMPPPQEAVGYLKEWGLPGSPT